MHHILIIIYCIWIIYNPRQGRFVKIIFNVRISTVF
nr:hypothetical protein TDPV-243 [Oriental turtle dovepox virus]